MQQNRRSVAKGEELMSEAWIIDAARTPREWVSRGRKPCGKCIRKSCCLRCLGRWLNEATSKRMKSTMSLCPAAASSRNRVPASVVWQPWMRFFDQSFRVTLDRFCGGGITAVNLAAANIMSGMEDLIVAGGVEMMSYTRSEAPPFPWMRVTKICADCIPSLMWAYPRTLLPQKKISAEQNWMRFHWRVSDGPGSLCKRALSTSRW